MGGITNIIVVVDVRRKDDAKCYEVDGTHTAGRGGGVGKSLARYHHLQLQNRTSTQQGTAGQRPCCSIAQSIMTTGMMLQTKERIGKVQAQSVSLNLVREKTKEQHSTAQHSTAQPHTAQHGTAQHSTAQHSTAGLALEPDSSSTLEKYVSMRTGGMKWCLAVRSLDNVLWVVSSTSQQCKLAKLSGASPNCHKLATEASQIRGTSIRQQNLPNWQME